MTTMARAIASLRVLSLSRRRATRYAKTMPKKHLDPLYTVARYTTAQAATMLGVERIAIQTAIRRGTLESELVSTRVRLISQAAIDAYRENHRGQVGHPTRKKQRMMKTMKAAAAETTPTLETRDEAQDGGQP